MKTPFYIVSAICIILFAFNITLNNTLDELQEKNLDIIDQYFDMNEKYTECQMDNSIMLDKIIELKNEK